jgi:hypothetical protein
MYTPFLDCFYSAILLQGISTKPDLQREIQNVAEQLFVERQPELHALHSGQCPTLDQWTRLVKRMIINPEEEDSGIVVSVRARGPASGHHDEIAEWVTIRLMAKAPDGHRIHWTRVTDAVGEAPGTSGWVILNEQGDRLLPVVLE